MGGGDNGKKWVVPLRRALDLFRFSIFMTQFYERRAKWPSLRVQFNDNSSIRTKRKFKLKIESMGLTQIYK